MVGKNNIDEMATDLSTNWQDIENQLPKNYNNVFIELISNSIHADAKTITLKFDINTKLGVPLTERITLSDDGHGIYDGLDEDIKLYEIKFATTAETYKKPSANTNGKGRGRFSAFKIGSNIIYNTKQRTTGKCYTVTLNWREPIHFERSNIDFTDGTTVIISKIKDDFSTKIDSDDLRECIMEHFALHILKYKITIILQECEGNSCTTIHTINESEINSKIERITYNDIASYNNNPVHAEIVYWKDFKNTKRTKAVYFCNSDGTFIADNFTKIEMPKKISMYLKSLGFSHNDIDFHTKEINDILDIARNKAWEFYNEKITKLNKERLDEFKKNGLLPLHNIPIPNPVTEIETKFLEMIAVQMDEILLLKTGQDRTKCRTSFIISCIHKLIENGNIDGYLSIMREAFDDNDNIKEILQISQYSNFVNLLKSGAFFNKRLLVLAGLRQCVDAYKLERLKGRTLKERTQLQKIIEDNAWVFGEEYALYSSDEKLHTIIKSITGQNLKKVEQDDGREGCVDILLKHQYRDNQYLLIELKAPNVKIDKNAIDQIEGYKITLQEKLSIENIISYCISTEISDTLQKNMEEDGKVRKGIYAFTWQEILDKIEKTYSQELQEISNEISMEDGYKYFKTRYSSIFGNDGNI